MQLLTTALFILKGKPRPAFFDALLPTVSPSIQTDFLALKPNEAGWRDVPSDGVNLLPADLIVVQDRFSVEDKDRKAFEESLAGGNNGDLGKKLTPGFFGSFVQRRDAVKPDDSFNYVVTSMWKDMGAFQSFQGGLPLNPAASSSVAYEAKLALLSESGP